MPQLPQLLLSVVRSRQLSAQMESPVRHETVHVPREHTVPDGQALPHAPQLLTSVARSRQTEVQLVVPSPHERAHAPAEHTWPAAQAIPHAPQWLRSVCVSRQTPEQLVVLAAHESTHAEPTQTSPEAQRVPQDPQLSRSPRVSAQYRGEPPPSAPASPWSGDMQVARFAAHSIEQAPLEQTSPRAHMTPHAPQLKRSVLAVTHVSPQRLCPVGQLVTHRPITQTLPP